MHRHTLSIDIETYSSVGINSGVYKYTEAPDFTILLIATSYAGEDIQVCDLTTEHKTMILLCLLTDPTVLKTAHNANFERTCLAKYFGIELPPEQWECTMVKASMLGLPMKLEQVAAVLKLSAQKDSAGKALINYFCKPCKPTKTNGGRTRNLPEHDPAKWTAFKEYCRQDVVVEMAIRERISWFSVPENEQKLWCLDQRINDEGVALDRMLVSNAQLVDADQRNLLLKEAVNITGLSNPNSNTQLMNWLNEHQDAGEEVTTLRKNDIPKLIESAIGEHIGRMLCIKQELSKTSVKKYKAMENYIGEDGRARGLFQFNGANRTGRWAGRGIQMQNLPRISLGNSCLDIARNLTLQRENDQIEMLYGNISDTLSQLIRTAFIPAKGHRFIVADFSSIEARVIAWLANEKWRLDVFNTHGKIYEASASAMFKVPLDKVTKDQRQRGKVAELALGYQGGKNALIAMGALDKGLTEQELQPIVDAWRLASPAIVCMWKSFDEAAIGAVETGSAYPVRCGVPGAAFDIRFRTQKGVLFMELPSGRALAYMRPKLKAGKFGKDALTYEGITQKNHQWGVNDTYGGSLVENCVQAIARDCLCYAMQSITDAGYKIVAHVHDEVICEVPDNFGSLEDVCRIMTQPIPWAGGLPLGADGFEGIYYKK